MRIAAVLRSITIIIIRYLYFPGELAVKSGQSFHLQYGEAWTSSTTTDNAGTTCADVYWKVGQCDVQSSGRRRLLRQ